MPDLKDNVIYIGKKTEVIRLDKINADLSINSTRQIFAKIPGINIWENDGSGIQSSIATRGLSPNRSWEFNVRQNSCDISSEIFGYPETYYTPPMEAIEKIEITRGSASLQFGPQFGGLVNYQIKKGNPNKILAFESQQTFGSYSLFNTFNSIGGTFKKLSYYGFVHHRNSNGWRENSIYEINTGYFSINYKLTKKINIGAEYTKMNYISQQPGGLTDSKFIENHRQSFRERNWFSAPFNILCFKINYNITEQINLQINSFINIAERNSVGFNKAITIKDTINSMTNQFSERQVDRDYYNNYGTEFRISNKYNFFRNENIFVCGIRIYNGNTKRNQLGIGTIGNKFDLSLTNSEFGRSINFETINYAFFTENVFQISKKLKLVPGFRIDYIENQMKGYINTNQIGLLISNNKTRQIILYGIGSEFNFSKNTNLYSNYSLAYRPVTFSELTPSASTEIIDPNLKDASGFNSDIGYRGVLKKIINFDFSLFYLHYDKRIGSIIKNDSLFKTNIGTSVSKGIESYIEINLSKIFIDNLNFCSFSLFVSNSFTNAKYINSNNLIIAFNPKVSIENKQVEYAPMYIHRFGMTYKIKEFSLTFQLSNVGSVYTDIANTNISNSTATIGKISGYQVMDASFYYKFMKQYILKFGVNNLSDVKYSTRRANGYPGPGIMPANGRTIFASFGVSI